MLKNRYFKWLFIITFLSILLFLSAVVCLTVGKVSIPPGVVFKIILNRMFDLGWTFEPSGWEKIVLLHRLPGVLMALFSVPAER